MEIKNKQTFFLAIFILLVWTFFGIPTSWKIFLTILSALCLIILSVKVELPRRGSMKRPIRRKEKVTPVFSQSAPINISTLDISLPKLPDVESQTDITNN
jgi:O-antigen/teichoic acid export membrane protein